MVILPWPSALRSEIRLLLISFFIFFGFCVFPFSVIPTVFPSNRFTGSRFTVEFGHNPCCLLPLKEVSAIAQPTPICSAVSIGKPPRLGGESIGLRSW